MPDIQEVIALAIVAAVAGVLLWRRWARRKSAAQTGTRGGDCGDCTAAGPPQKEATVHFYRKRDAGRPADDPSRDGG